MLRERGLQIVEVEQDVPCGGVADPALDPADAGEARAAGHGAHFVDGAGRVEDKVAGAGLGGSEGW